MEYCNFFLKKFLQKNERNYILCQTVVHLHCWHGASSTNASCHLANTCFYLANLHKTQPKPRKNKTNKKKQINQKKANKPSFLTPRQMNVFWCHGSDFPGFSGLFVFCMFICSGFGWRFIEICQITGGIWQIIRGICM